MRAISRLTVALAIVGTAIGSGRAEAPTIKLPKEGGWARYHAITKERGREEVIATLMLKSLGNTAVDGIPCRWIESEYINEREKRHERTKVLLSERAMKSAERPFEEALRYLQQNDAEAVTSVPAEEQAWMATNFLYFPGFLKNAKLADDPRTVKYQKGTLEISQAYVGTYRWWRKGQFPDDATVFETSYRVWLHPDLPVGFAHAQTTLRLVKQDKELRSWQLDYALQEFGHDARAAIPEETAPAAKP